MILGIENMTLGIENMTLGIENMTLGIENMTLGIENMTLGKAGGRGSWLRELRSQVYAQLVCNISGEH
jgi:hypothetical protein